MKVALIICLLFPVVAVAQWGKNTGDFKRSKGLYTDSITLLAVSGGNVGIGNSSPSEKLSVTGNIVAAAPDYSSGSYSILVRNTTSGRFEKVAASSLTPTLDSVMAKGSTLSTNRTVNASGFNYGITASNINITGSTTIAGAFSTPIGEFATGATLGANDHVITATASGITFTLPSAVGISGREYVIVNASSGSITLNTTSSQTIGNFTTTTSLSIASDKAYRVKSNGSNWRIIGQN